MKDKSTCIARQQPTQELATIIDRISALIVRYRSDGTPDFVNKTWREYTGLALSDVVRSCWEAVHPDDRSEGERRWRVLFADGEPFSSELRLRRADGRYRWHRIDLRPLRTPDGPIANWYGVCHDVDDRKRLDRETLAAGETLRSTINFIPSLVWQADPSGAVEFYNARWQEYAGRLSEAEGWDWRSIVHPDDAAGLADAWREKLESGKPFDIETRMRRSDGEYRWFLIRAEPSCDPSGRVSRWYGINTDIEDRKRAEDALRESEQRFRDFSGSTSDWYWETGPDHCFTHMPAGRPEFLSISHPLPIDVHRWENAADFEEEPAKWRDHIATLDAHLPFRGFTYQVRRKDGSIIYMGVTGIPRFDANGCFIGYRGGGSDVTAAVHARQSEEALRKAQIEIAHVTRVTTLGELSASIAHEVIQPLARVAGNGVACLRWLSRDPPHLAEVRASVEAMMLECGRAGSIISKVRALAQKGSPQMAELDVNDIVRESVALVQHTIQRHHVRLMVELHAIPLDIMGDRIQLQQVVINLVMNGVESMENVNGRARQMMIRSRPTEGAVIVEIQDSGNGVDAHDLGRLFEAFFTTKVGGLGMGLPISRSLIEAHGGRLSVETHDKYGATFRIELPALPARSPKVGTPAVE